MPGPRGFSCGFTTQRKGVVTPDPRETYYQTPTKTLLSKKGGKKTPTAHRRLAPCMKRCSTFCGSLLGPNRLILKVGLTKWWVSNLYQKWSLTYVKVGLGPTYCQFANLKVPGYSLGIWMSRTSRLVRKIGYFLKISPYIKFGFQTQNKCLKKERPLSSSCCCKLTYRWWVTWQ